MSGLKKVGIELVVEGGARYAASIGTADKLTDRLGETLTQAARATTQFGAAGKRIEDMLGGIGRGSLGANAGVSALDRTLGAVARAADSAADQLNDLHKQLGDVSRASVATAAKLSLVGAAVGGIGVAGFAAGAAAIGAGIAAVNVAAVAGAGALLGFGVALNALDEAKPVQASMEGVRKEIEKLQNAGVTTGPAIDGLRYRLAVLEKEYDSTFIGMAGTIKNFAADALKTASLPLFNRMKDGLAEVVDFIQSPAVTDAVPRMGLMVGQAVDSMIASIKKVLPAVDDWDMVIRTKQDALSLWVQDFTAAFDKALPVIVGMGQAIGTVAGAMGGPVVQGLKLFAGGLADIDTKSMTFQNNVKDLAGIFEFLGRVMAASSKIVSNLVGGFVMGLGPALDRLARGFDNTVDQAGGFDRLLENIGKTVMPVGKAIGLIVGATVEFGVAVTNALGKLGIFEAGLRGLEAVSNLLSVAVSKLGDFLNNRAVPAAKLFFGWLGEVASPIVKGLSDVFETTILPAVGRFGTFLESTVLPKLRDFWVFFDANITPTLKAFADFIGTTVLPVLGKIGEFVLDRALPALVEFGSTIAGVVGPILANLSKFIRDDVLPKFASMGDFIEVNVIPAFGKFTSFVQADVLPLIKKIGEFLTPGLTVPMGIFQAAWGVTWGAVELIIKSAWTTIEMVLETFKRGFQATAQMLKGDFLGAWNTVTADFTIGASKMEVALLNMASKVQAAVAAANPYTDAVDRAGGKTRDWVRASEDVAIKAEIATGKVGPFGQAIDGTITPIHNSWTELNLLNNEVDRLKQATDAASTAVNENKKALSDLDGIVATMPPGINSLWSEWKILNQQAYDGGQVNKDYVAQANEVRNKLVNLDPALKNITKLYTDNHVQLGRNTDAFGDYRVAAMLAANDSSKLEKAQAETLTTAGRLKASMELLTSPITKIGMAANTTADQTFKGSSTMQNALAGLGKAFTLVSGVAKTEMDKVGSSVKDTDLSGAGNDIGKSLMDGIVAGIQGNVLSAVNAAAVAAERVSGAARTQFVMRSPSKIFAYIGKMLMAGLAEGIDANTDDPVGAITKMAGEVSDEALTKLEKQFDVMGKIGSTIGGFADALTKLKSVGSVGAGALATFTGESDLLVKSFVTSAGNYTEKMLEAADKYLDTTNKVAGTTSAMADALVKIQNRAVVGKDAIFGFGQDSFSLVAEFYNASTYFTVKMLFAASNFAETANTVATSAGVMADSLKKVGDLAVVGKDAIFGFGQDSFSMVAEYFNASRYFTDRMLEAVEKFSNTSGIVAAGAGAMADALGKVAGRAVVGRDTIYGFGQDIFSLVAEFFNTSRYFSGEMLKATDSFAETTSKVGAGAGVMADVFPKLKDRAVIGRDAIFGFGQDIFSLTAEFYNASVYFTEKMLAGTGLFSDTLAKVGAGAAAAFGILKELPKYVSPGETNIIGFANDSGLLAKAYYAIAKTFDDEMLKVTSALAETLGKVSSGAGGAFSLLTNLKDYVNVGVGAIDAFGVDTGLLTSRMATIAATFSAEALTAISAFGESIGKLFAGLKDAMTLFGGLHQLTDTPSKVLTAFMDNVELTVSLAGQMAQRAGTELLGQIQAFGAAIAALFAGMKNAMDVFMGMRSKEFANQPSITMQAFIDQIVYTVSLAADMAARTDKELLGQATAFATAIDKIFSKLKSALDIFKGIEGLKDIPSNVLGKILEGVSAAIVKMAGLNEVADAYKSGAQTFANTMRDAAELIAAGMAAGAGSFGNIPVPAATTPSIPGMADGGTTDRSGLFKVGERGPELLWLPKGATVFDALTTSNLFGNASSAMISPPATANQIYNQQMIYNQQQASQVTYDQRQMHSHFNQTNNHITPDAAQDYYIARVMAGWG